MPEYQLIDKDENIAERNILAFVEFSEWAHYSFGSKVSDVITKQLWKDGLLIEGEENTIELSGKDMKVNGEIQTEDVWQKYKEIYEDGTGHELGKSSKIVYKISGEKPKWKRAKKGSETNKVY